MKQRELRYRISKKGFSRFAFPEVNTGRAQEHTSPAKRGKIYRAGGGAGEKSRIPSARSAETMEVTLGYCAIRNFKNILKHWSDDRERLHIYINGFIEAVTEIVGGQGGTVEKFSGNGILFAFGHEAASPEDLKNAILAALKIRYRMNKLNRSWNLHHEDAWKLGIGVARGNALVEKESGGKDCRLSFRGDLPGLAKGLGDSAHSSQIIVTEETFRGPSFPKEFIETNEPYHVQLRGTDYLTRVREIIAINRDQEIM